MKLKLAFFALLLFLLLCFVLGCANVSLQTIKDVERKNTATLVKAYDDALQSLYFERIEIEDQFIEMQKKDALIVNGYILKTGITPEQIREENSFSISSFDAFNKPFEDAKQKRMEEIKNSYNDFRLAIDSKIDENKMLQTIIDGIENDRKDFFSNWESFLFNKNGEK